LSDFLVGTPRLNRHLERPSATRSGHCRACLRATAIVRGKATAKTEFGAKLTVSFSRRLRGSHDAIAVIAKSVAFI